MNACILHRRKWWKPQRILEITAKKIHVPKSSFGDVECITQQPTVFFGSMDCPLAEVWKIVIWSRSSKQRWWCLSSEIDLKRQIQPKETVCFHVFSMCFPCVSYCFPCVFYVFPIVSYVFPMCFMYCISYVLYFFLACSGAFCATPGVPPLQK